MKKAHETVLRGEEFKNKLNFNLQPNQQLRNRNRKIIFFWFNLTFNLRNNIGKLFLKLRTKHFPKTSNLIFNKNTVKLIYCCTNNLDNIIKKHSTGSSRMHIVKIPTSALHLQG